MELSQKEKHKRHREKNLIAKHLKENRDRLYRLRVVKPKVDEDSLSPLRRMSHYKRSKIKVKDIEKIIDDEVVASEKETFSIDEEE